MASEPFAAMRNAEEIDRGALADIRTVRLGQILPAAQRAEQYLEPTQNPSCFLCGDTVVRVRFSSGGSSLEHHLKRYVMQLR